MIKIEKIRLKDINPYENNAKKHPEVQLEQIKKSIELFGYNDPIAIDENNIIIEGHGRYEVLKRLRYDEIEVIRLSHLTEIDKRAYILAHNKINMNTGFDFLVLKEEMKNILNDYVISPEEFGIILDDEVLENDDLKDSMNDRIIKSKKLICPCCKQKNEKNKFKEVLNG